MKQTDYPPRLEEISFQLQKVLCQSGGIHDLNENTPISGDDFFNE